MDTLAYFQLNEQPFRLGPDPRYLFFSDQVKEAISKCEYMAQERIGPIYLYGPIGSGKTSILRRLYDRLSQDNHYRTTLVISPNVKTANAFLRVILESFEVKTERSYDQTLKNFERFLVEQYKKGEPRHPETHSLSAQLRDRNHKTPAGGAYGARGAGHENLALPRAGLTHVSHCHQRHVPYRHAEHD